MTADRRKRHLRILELISTRPVRTQGELVEVLATEGWEVTQSSVSRDVSALRLVKVGGIYHRPAAVARVTDPDELRIAEGVLTVDAAGDALVVVHTPPGEANRVGVALDRLSWPEILGTIAGDDTIFLAVKDARAQQQVMRRIRGIARAR
jgi:transcriptional regulator of arginine metabolism